MSTLKKLAGQTMWYGVSNIAGRLITALLTPYLTYTLVGVSGQVEYGAYSYVYLWLPVFNVLYTYGMETAFFRYSQEYKDDLHLYRVQFTMVLFSTLLFSVLLYAFRAPIATFMEVAHKPEYVLWCMAIVGMDALAALPYARLRRENKPRKYAFTRVAGIIVFVATIVGLFSFGKHIQHSGFQHWYKLHWGLGFILFANVMQCLVTLLLLYRELSDVRITWDKVLWKKLMRYGLPILVAGLGGVMNDTLNRAMFKEMYQAAPAEKLRQLGIFSATVRLAIMITLAVQAFRMAAEPFFFSIAKNADAKQNYARIMLWFCITLAFMFLHLILFIDLWQYFIGSDYREALYLTPILLLANIFMGIYYNLTIWYKLTDQTKFGAYIMLIGAFVTVTFNYFTIHSLGYKSSAYSMLLSSTVMMVLSYALGQKYYPVPYPVRKIGFYFLWMLCLSAVQGVVLYTVPWLAVRLFTGMLLFVAFAVLVIKSERLPIDKIWARFR